MYIPDFIKSEYEQRRQKNQAALEKRIQAVRKKTVQIDEIENQKLHLAYDLSSFAFSAATDEYQNEKANVEEKLNELTDLEKQILRDNGFSPDYLDIKYVCNACHDTGYNIKDGSMCTCLKNRIMQYNYASSNLNNGECFENYNLNIFKDEKQRHRMSKVYDFALNYAQSLPSPTPLNVLLLGSTGLGKSFTLNCIAHKAVDMGLNVIKITAYNMFDSILEAVKGERPMPDYLSCDLLAIDDLGTEPLLKNITTEKLFHIINEREARNKPIVIASNLSKTDILQRYDERIGSRLLTPKYNTVISLYGDDIRLLQ